MKLRKSTFTLVYRLLLTLLGSAAGVACGAEQAVQPIKAREAATSTAQVVSAQSAGSEAEDKDASYPLELSPEDADRPITFERLGDVSIYHELGSLSRRKEEMLGHTPNALTALLGGSEYGQDAVCQGPWGSSLFDCFREGTSASCGVLTEQVDEEVVEYNGCARPEFGQLGLILDHETAITEAVQTIYGGNVCKKGGKNLDEGEPLIAATSACSQHFTRLIKAQAGRADWTASCSQVRRMAEPKRPLGKSCHFGGKKSYVLWSADVRFMRPVYVYRTSDPACGRKTPIIMRRVQDRTYQTCRLPEFGRELSNVCGSPETWVMSQPGMRRSQFDFERQIRRAEGVSAVRCMTCDDLPLGSEARVGDKWSCLRQSLEQVGPRLLAAGAIRSPDEARLSELYEELMRRGRALFEANFTERLTSADVLPLYALEQPAGSQHFAAPLQAEVQQAARWRLCRALLQSHVSPQRIAGEFADCLQLAHGDASLSADSTAGDDASQVAAAQLGMSLFARFVRGMGDGAQTDFGARQVADQMAEAWHKQAQDNVQLSHVPRHELARVRDLMHGYVDHEQAARAPAASER